MQSETKNGLGDNVERLIKAVLPEAAERKKDCVRCKERKKWLNNIGAIFS